MYEDNQFENLTEQQVDAIVVENGNQVVAQDGANVVGTATAQSVLEGNASSTGTLQQSAGETTSSSPVDLPKSGFADSTQAPATEITPKATAKTAVEAIMPVSQAQIRPKQTVLPKKAATKKSNAWSQIAPPKSQAQIRPKQTILPRRPSLSLSAKSAGPLKTDVMPEAQVRPKQTFLPLKSAFPAPSVTATNTATGTPKSVNVPRKSVPAVQIQPTGAKKEATLPDKSLQATNSLANKEATPVVISSKPTNPAATTEPIDITKAAAIIAKNLRKAADAATKLTAKMVEKGVEVAREPPPKDKNSVPLPTTTSASSLKNLQNAGDGDESAKLESEKDNKKLADEQTKKAESAATTSPTTTTINTATTSSSPSPSSATGKRLDSPSSQCQEISKKQRTSQEQSPSAPGVTTGADGKDMVVSLPPKTSAVRESNQTKNATEVSVNTKMASTAVDGKILRVVVEDGDAIKKSGVLTGLPASLSTEKKQQNAPPKDMPMPSNGTSTKAIAPDIAANPPANTLDRQTTITPKPADSAFVPKESLTKMPAVAPESVSLQKNADPVSKPSVATKVVSGTALRDTLSNIVNQAETPRASTTKLSFANATDVDNDNPKISDACEASTETMAAPGPKLKVNPAIEMDVENKASGGGGKYAEVASTFDAKPITVKEFVVDNDKPTINDAGEKSTETVSVPVKLRNSVTIYVKADNQMAVTSPSKKGADEGIPKLEIDKHVSGEVMNVFQDTSDIQSCEKLAVTLTAQSVDKEQTPKTVAQITDSTSVTRSNVADSENQLTFDARKTSACRSGKCIEENTKEETCSAEKRTELCETRKTEAELLTPRAQNVVHDAVLPVSIDIPGLAALESSRDTTTTKSLLTEKIKPQEKSKIKQDDSADSSKISQVVRGVEKPKSQQLPQSADSVNTASATVHEKGAKKRDEKQTDDDVNSTISRESSEPSLVSLVAMTSSPERKAIEAGASGAEALGAAIRQAAGKLLDPAKKQGHEQSQVSGESAVMLPVKVDAANEIKPLLSTKEKAGVSLESITQPSKPAENGVGNTSVSLKSNSVLEKAVIEGQSIESPQPTNGNSDSVAASRERGTPASEKKRRKKRPSPKAGFDDSTGRKARRVTQEKAGQDAPAAIPAPAATPTKVREKRNGEKGQAASMNSENEKEGTTLAGKSCDNIADLMVLAATMVSMQSGALSGKAKAPPKESQGMKAIAEQSHGAAGAGPNTTEAHVHYPQQPEEGTVCPECCVRVEDLTEFPVDWTRPLHYPEDADTIEIINDHAARHHVDVPLWNTLEATICKQLASAPPKSIITPKAYVRLALRHAMCCSYGIDESLLDMNKLRDLFVRRFGIARGFIEWSSDYFIRGRTLTNNLGEKVSSTELRKAALLLLAFLEKEVIEQAFDKKLHLTEKLSRTLPLQTWRNRVQLVFLDPNGMDNAWFMKA